MSDANSKIVLKQEKIGLFGSTLFYGMGNFFSRSIAFLLLPLYTNILSTYEFGVFSLLYSTYSLLSFIFPSALQYGFLQFYLEAKDEFSKKKIYTSTLYLTVFISACFTLLLITLSDNFSDLILGSTQYANLFAFMVLLLFFDNLNFFVMNFLKTNQYAKKVMMYVLIAAINNIIFNIIFLFVFNLKIEGIFLSQLFSNLINTIILIIEQRKFIISFIDLSVIKKMLLFSLPLIISGIFGTLIDVVDRYILDFYLDKSAVGVYSFSYRIAMVMNMLVYSFRTAWLPYGKKEFLDGNYSENFSFNFTKLIALSTLLFVLVTLFVDDLFDITIFGYNFFNANYNAGTEIISIIMLGYFFNGIFTFYSVYPFIIGQSKHLLIADGIALIFNIILNIFLIPIYGILGAAIATAFSFFMNAAYLFLISYSDLKINYQHKSIIAILFATILTCYIGIKFEVFVIDLILAASFITVLMISLKLNFTKIYGTIKNIILYKI